MRFYSVHDNGESGPAARLLLLREGFSWPAFLFGPLWALWHGLWQVAIGLFLAALVLSLFLQGLGFSESHGFAAQLGLNLLMGLMGQDLRRWGLKRRGYDMAGVVTGDDREGALRRFLDRSPALAARLVG